MRAWVFKFLIHLESGQVYCGTENQDAEIYFYILFPFFLYFHLSNVIDREICVKDFSGTTAPRVLFDANVGYDLLYRVKENQLALLIIPLICPFFFISSKFSVTNFLASMRARVFKFCKHIESGQVYCGTENKSEIYFAVFFHLSLQCNT